MAILEKPTVVPSQEDIALAKLNRSKLAEIEGRESNSLCVLTDGDTSFEIPQSVFLVLVDILHAMAEGKGIQVVPVDAELTTQEAADLLNVSRPYLVKLLDENKIPYRTVGRYRRVRYEDLLKYQHGVERKRNAALDDMVAQAQALGMGY